MPQQTPPNLLNLTVLELSFGRTHTAALDAMFAQKKGELTFSTPGYNIRKQPAQFQPRMIAAGVAVQHLSAQLRREPLV